MPERRPLDPRAARLRLRRLAWLLDSAVRLPGGFSIGIDGVLGLVPGAGDLLGAALSSYIVVEAARQRAPASVLLRMVANVALELVIGVVPLFGDLFDIVFKANQRNVELLERWLDAPQATRSVSRAAVTVVLLLLALLLFAVLALLFASLRWLWAASTG